MADSFARGESSHQGMPEPLRSSQFPEIASTTTQVVLVMDGPKEFTIKPLKWALENISASGGIKVPLLGAMPWINIPRCATKGSCNRVSLEIGSGRKTYKPSCDMGGF
uniref:Uncharacterized protein n=1 Tax=Populus trichocarpa TaxID=3694 RepID=U5GIZ6_POPTR